jgi:hypothetical protein
MMKSHSEPVSIPKDTRTMRDNPRTNGPCTVLNPRYRNVLVEHSRSTR